MKIALQYVSDPNGRLYAVQLPITEWEKVLARIKKYEQILKLKSDIREALNEVHQLKSSKKRKQTLTEFLNEL